MSYNNTHLLGTIISSILDYDHMSVITGDPNPIKPSKSIWIPCDGRSIKGSKLAEKTNMTSAPDLRGKFLRGLNIVHSDGQPDFNPGQSDTDGTNRIPGSYQADQLHAHDHNLIIYRDPRADFRSGLSGAGYHNSGEFSGASTYLGGTSETGGLETRPKNIAVYYYLKIN